MRTSLFPIEQAHPNSMRYLILCVALIMAVVSHAQTAGTDASQRWQELQERRIPALAKKPARTNPRTAQEQAQERRELTAHYSSLAGAAKGFRQSYPTDAKAKDSLIMEAESLLKVAFLGDDTQAGYTETLVDEIRSDASLPASLRYRIAALAENLKLRKKGRTIGEARVAREAVARRLMNEFPAEEGGYQMLLSVAEASAERRTIEAVVQEIESSAAPFAAKAAARVVATRYSLIGKSLADVANTALGRENFFEAARGRRTVLYTWASWSPGSVEFAKNVLSKISGDYLLIGYNLDRDVDAARELARKEKLPGTHYYDSAGLGSWLTLLLSLDSAPLVYVTDQSGVITDVTAQRRDILSALTPKGGN